MIQYMFLTVMLTLTHSVESFKLLEDNFQGLKFLKICGDILWSLLEYTYRE